MSALNIMTSIRLNIEEARAIQLESAIEQLDVFIDQATTNVIHNTLTLIQKAMREELEERVKGNKEEPVMTAPPQDYYETGTQSHEIDEATQELLATHTQVTSQSKYNNDPCIQCGSRALKAGRICPNCWL